MRFSGIFVTLAVLAALAVGAPHTNAHDVVVDMQVLGRSIGTLHGHANQLGQPDFNIMSMLTDNEEIIKGLDHLAKDASATKSFTSAEASTIISVTKGVANEVGEVSKIFISKKDTIPVSFRRAVVEYLREIIAHSKTAGEALIRGCPPDKRAEADKVYGAIGRALEDAVKVFSFGS